jgi:hypothetical protein
MTRRLAAVLTILLALAAAARTRDAAPTARREKTPPAQNPGREGSAPPMRNTEGEA